VERLSEVENSCEESIVEGDWHPGKRAQGRREGLRLPAAAIKESSGSVIWMSEQ